MMHRWLVLIALACALPAAHAQAPADALQRLQRVADAAQKLDYSGVFVYQSGKQSETSRITHIVDGGTEYERLEVLDGSPREVLRVNDEVKCYLPESRLLIVERRRRGQAVSFPALTAEGLKGVTNHYVITKGPSARIAGLDSDSLVIKPKDGWRYGHRLWVDAASGLLLKAALVDERGEVLESFSFTELRIGGPVDRASLKPHGVESDWKVHDVRTADAGAVRWQFNGQPPGFLKVADMVRQGRGDGREVGHVMFSDGLATVSVFIEPAAGRNKLASGAMTLGAVNAYKRIAGDHVFIVMGDVPPAALKAIAEGIEPKK